MVFLACILSGSEGNLIEILLAFGLPSEFAEDPTADGENGLPGYGFWGFLVAYLSSSWTRKTRTARKCVSKMRWV